MSLRARLALLYTSFVGGILLLFGMAIFLTVSRTLTQQVDNLLQRAASEIITSSRAITDLNLISIPDIDFSADVYVQVWARNETLLAQSPNLPEAFNQPLDPYHVLTSVTSWGEVAIDGARLRVLSVPLVIGDSSRIFAVLQTATSLSVVHRTQQVLLWVLIVGVVAAMALAAAAGWYSTRQALAPLNAVTQTALQITRADDLSRRIPYSGPAGDEVGQLIHAFNQTLGRLENLFVSQRRFLADVGHELRTPLTVIKGNVDLLRRMNCTDEESLGSIESETDRLARLVGDLLLLAQAESGKLPLAWRTVELDTLLLEALQQMNVLARGRLTLRLGEIDQVLVCGDSDRLKQVLINLIGNAIQYTPSGGEVVVNLGKENGRAHLTVSDTGPGIPADDLPHIFERFYRGEKSRTRAREGKGFGLGLSIAYWIVRNHKGQIEAANRQPTGATFSIWLPLSDGQCQPEENA